MEGIVVLAYERVEDLQRETCAVSFETASFAAPCHTKARVPILATAERLASHVAESVPLARPAGVEPGDTDSLVRKAGSAVAGIPHASPNEAFDVNARSSWSEATRCTVSVTLPELRERTPCSAEAMRSFLESRMARRLSSANNTVRIDSFIGMVEPLVFVGS